MGKILVFIYDEMADFEVTFITHLLGADLDKEIITAGYDDKLIRSKSGIIYKPSKLIKNILDDLDDDIEGLIIPGGWNGEILKYVIGLVILRIKKIEIVLQKLLKVYNYKYLRIIRY
ncbi:DJ-1/PfpI family protein [Haloimpatiens massiliensis]|uniref:DJ-1/PfpI family protein n=1 Tax=Haloimpatiens massiliensis TaxID=1658110 RepID=UPI000C82C54D|nr:DJ-1/PfpI family protein [Haloimpatiens massiliensis]